MGPATFTLFPFWVSHAALAAGCATPPPPSVSTFPLPRGFCLPGPNACPNTQPTRIVDRWGDVGGGAVESREGRHGFFASPRQSSFGHRPAAHGGQPRAVWRRSAAARFAPQVRPGCPRLSARVPPLPVVQPHRLPLRAGAPHPGPACALGGGVSAPQMVRFADAPPPFPGMGTVDPGASPWHVDMHFVGEEVCPLGVWTSL